MAKVPTIARLATAAAGTSIGVLYAVSSRRDALEREGYPPVTHPGCPDYLQADAELLESPTAARHVERFDGLWLAWYNSPLVLRLASSNQQLDATHLTGTFAVPAGNRAFAVRVDPACGALHGEHVGSLLPHGLWLSSAPCRLNTYSTDLSRRTLDDAVLSVDISVLSWLPPVRVPLRRIPDTAFIARDSDGFVLAGSDALRGAQAAVAEARFDERLLGGL